MIDILYHKEKEFTTTITLYEIRRGEEFKIEQMELEGHRTTEDVLSTFFYSFEDSELQNLRNYVHVRISYFEKNKDNADAVQLGNYDYLILKGNIINNIYSEFVLINHDNYCLLAKYLLATKVNLKGTICADNDVFEVDNLVLFEKSITYTDLLDELFSLYPIDLNYTKLDIKLDCELMFGWVKNLDYSDEDIKDKVEESLNKPIKGYYEVENFTIEHSSGVSYKNK